MKIARVLCLVLAVLLMVSMCISCKTTTSQTSSKDDVTSKNPSEWSSTDSDGSSEEFDDGSSDESVVLPGDSSTPSEDEPSEEPSDEPNEDPDENFDGDEPGEEDEGPSGWEDDSVFADKASLQYYYENDVYAYGITEYGDEVFAYRDGEDKYFDVMSGAGDAILCNQANLELLSTYSVAQYERTLINNTLAIVVTYSVFDIGSNGGSVAQATYVMNDDYVDVSYRIAYTSVQGETVLATHSYIRRGVRAEYESVEKNMATNWNYPADNDFPYKSVRAYVSKINFDDVHSLYTFNYGNIPQTYDRDVYFEKEYPEINVPVFFGDGTGVDYTAKYAMVFGRNDGKVNADYSAFFLSDGSDFAAGIAPITANDDNTTLFVKDKVEFNLNVTNLSGVDTTFTARYDIRDYYGNILDAGIYTNSTVFADLDANRKITIDANKTGYGMYFINFKVMTKYYTYSEYYPVILLENADYPNRASYPFGITQLLDQVNLHDGYSIMMKLGCGYNRSAVAAFDTDERIAECKKYLEAYKQAGLHIAYGGIPWGDMESAAGDLWYEHYGQYFTHVCEGNEANMILNMVSANPPKSEVDRVWNEYYNKHYAKSQRLATKHGKKIMFAGISAGMNNWLDKIAEVGLWRSNNNDLSIHVYSMNWRSPDNIEDIKGDAMWGVESGFIRVQKALQRHGQKTWYANEMGYTCAYGNPEFVDPRTKADYDIRCFFIAAKYGAKGAITYCLFDYSNDGWGTHPTDIEYSFGAFYFPDYFRRIFPKPTANGFITMSHVIDGYLSCTESTKYSNGPLQDQNGRGTLRVFDVNTTVNGHVFVAWSNCKLQENETRAPRNPQLPWNPTEFTETEDLIVDAIGSSVTVIDMGGKKTTYQAVGGKATIPVSGAPIYILGAK